MGLGTLFGLLGGSLLNGAFGLFGQKRGNSLSEKSSARLMTLQNDLNRKNVLDGPTLTKQGFQRAGLSLASAAGGYSPVAGVGIGGGSAPSSVGTLDLSSLVNAISSANLSKAQADKTKAETEGVKIDNDNKQRMYDSQINLNDITALLHDSQIGVNNETENQIYNYVRTIMPLDADRIESETGLNNSQITLNGKRLDELDSVISSNNANAFYRNLEGQLLESSFGDQLRKIAADADCSEKEVARIAAERYVAVAQGKTLDSQTALNNVREKFERDTSSSRSSEITSRTVSNYVTACSKVNDSVLEWFKLLHPKTAVGDALKIFIKQSK